MSRKFTITTGPRAKHKVWDKPESIDLARLAEELTFHRHRDSKDGPCYIPGSLVGNNRTAGGVNQIDILVYDIDGGQTFAELDAILNELNVVAFLHTSFSHLTTTTKIASNAYEQWANKNNAPLPPTQKAMLDYLEAVGKTHLTNVDFNLSSDKRSEREKYVRNSGDGIEFIVHHDPVEKYRVMFPLDHPIVMVQLGFTTRQFTENYKSIYHGVGRALGLKYDGACEDSSRLYYFPATRNGSTEGVDYFATMYGCTGVDDLEQGNLLDWEKYPRFSKADAKKDGSKTPVDPAKYSVTDRDGRPVNLLKWGKTNHDFDIESLLQRVLPEDQLGEDRAGKEGFHITCPFEDQHTSPGGKGTWAANSDGDRPWMIQCQHTSCKVTNERRNLDFLAELIRQGYVTADDLGIQQPVSKEEVAAVLGVDASTLPDEVGDEDDGTADVIIAATDDDDFLVPEDRLKDASDVYSEALGQILAAKLIGDLRNAFRRMLDKKCDIAVEDITEVIAKSSLGGTPVKRFLRSAAQAMNSDFDECLDMIRNQRETDFPISQAIGELHIRGIAGGKLVDEQKRLADHYFLDKRTVREKFDAYQTDSFNQEYGENATDIVNDLSNRYAKVIIGKDMNYIDKMRSRRLRAPQLLSHSALSGILRNRSVVVEVAGRDGKKKKKSRKIFDVWCEEALNIEEYDGVTMIPQQPERVDNKFNVWDDKATNFNVKPEKGDVSIITNHILEAWCNGDEKLFGYVMMWFADIIQNPGNKPHTALLLIGGQGTGKSVICDVGMSAILGGFYGKSAKRDDIVGKFNSMLVGKLLWLSEESLFAGDKMSMQVLKDRITSPTIDVEYKGVDKFQYPSYTRFIFTSNMEHAADLEHDDRRFVVLRTSDKYQRNKEYFKKMVDWFRDDHGVQKFLNYLLTFKPEAYGWTWDDLMDAPDTEYKRAQIEMSLSTAEMFFVELIKHGRPTDTPSSVFMDGRVSWPLDLPEGEEDYLVDPQVLQGAFTAYIRHHGGGSAKYDRGKFTAFFKKYIGRGRAPSDFSKPVRVPGQSKQVRRLALPARRVLMQQAIKNRFITESDLMLAVDNPTSHLYNESDVL